MYTVAIVTRRLKEGKTYKDFRKAWFHTTGFGTKSNLFTMINAFDPKEVTVIGFTKTDIDDLEKTLNIDVKERLENPLDDVIESENISRKFGLLVSEDDFSTEGDIAFQPASVDGEETDLELLADNLEKVATMIRAASEKRDHLKNKDSEIT